MKKRNKKHLSPLAAAFFTAAVGYVGVSEYKSFVGNDADTNRVIYNSINHLLEAEDLVTDSAPAINVVEAYKNSSALYGREKVSVDTGLDDLCKDRPDFCTPYHNPGSVVSLTPETLETLSDVNVFVNFMIAPQDDIVTYGVDEKWVAPSIGTNLLPARGDCEEYVLAKMQLLISKHDFDPAHFSIVIVDDENVDDGIYHAILGVHTDQGTLLMDNLNDDLKYPHEVDYTFKYMQSYDTQNKWVRAEVEVPQYFADGLSIEKIIDDSDDVQVSVPSISHPLPRPRPVR